MGNPRPRTVHTGLPLGKACIAGACPHRSRVLFPPPVPRATQAQQDTSHTKALGDPEIRPSQRQEKHDALLEAKRRTLEDTAMRISELEAREENLRRKLDAAGGTPVVAGAGSGDGGEGWAAYLDEQSGRYYWYNDGTGEAYYDDEK